MAKEIKAERAFTDADGFPRESFRERLSRQYGIDSVALSGPCEGQNLVDCVVNQLERRWDRIKSRFAGSNDKAFKLAINIAESYRMKDDTEKCVKDLQSLGYNEAAAAGIATYLKAYSIEAANDAEIKTAMGEIYAEEPAGAMPADGGFGGDAAPAPAGEMPMEPAGGEMPSDIPPPIGGEEPMMDDGMGGEEPPMDMPGEEMPGEGGMVTIELPMELAEELKSAIETQTGGGDMGGMPPEEGGAPGLDIEVMDMPGEEVPGGDLHGDGIEEVTDEIVPGEPEAGLDEHHVEGGEEKAMSGGGAEMPMMAGSGHAPGKCKACGSEMASEGNGEHSVIQDIAEAVHNLESGEKHEGEESHETHEKREDKNIDSLEKDVNKLEDHESKEGSSAEKAENKEFGEKVYEASSAKAAKMASLNMRQGHLRTVGAQRPVKTAQEIARLGNPMKMNSTDQIGPHEGKELGNAKDKTPDAPKPVSEGNVELEGYSANDKKYQDGATMGHEQKFEAHKVEESEFTGGDKSLMGKDESFPKDKPTVPAGSAPIGGEVWTGGDLATKGTVIATIKPNGILVEVDGKKFLAKKDIKKEMVAKIEAGLAKIAFNGDGREFAKAALKVVKEAEESGKVDNVTKIDTSKLEGEKFTNDAEKKPVEGGAMTGKGKGEDYQNKDIVETNTSKLEKEKFTNDAEKKPEDAPKEAAVKAVVKTAEENTPREKDGPKDYNKPVANTGDKAVEAPKALEDGNVHPEGFTAGGDKFSDGKTLGHEQKFEAHKVEEKEYTGGDSSLQGKDESIPKDGPKVPAGKGHMGHEIWEGGDLSTKGTTIADNNSQKRQVSAEEAELRAKLAEATVKEARMKAASIYVADALAHGDIREDQYIAEFEKVSAMSVPAIQSLIANTKQMRVRLAARAEARKPEGKVAGLTLPYVHASTNETSLKDQLIANFKLTRTLDQIDEMKK